MEYDYLYKDYIEYEDIINSKEIFIVPGESGTFFLCFDWYAPEEAKLWYKFSINPFDIDFLKFRKMESGFISKNDGLVLFDKFISYLTKSKSIDKKVLHDSFFTGGKIINFARANDYKSSKISKLKARYTKLIKDWIKRLYKEYNFMDDSIEYIKDYYCNWVTLIDYIYTRPDTNNLWTFIEEHKIKNVVDYWVELTYYLSKYMKNELDKFTLNDITVLNNMCKTSRVSSNYVSYTIDIGLDYTGYQINKKVYNDYLENIKG